MTPREDLADAISTVEAPRARKRFRTDLRRALIATAASEWTATSQPQSQRRRPWVALPSSAAPRYALAFAVVMLAIFTAGGVAAASSLPGDVTYSLKLAYEEVELTLASDDAARVEVLARQADRRLEELNQVSASRPEQAPTASAAYLETVAKFEAAVVALKGAAPADKEDAAVDVAVTAAEKHIAILEQLKARHDTPGIDNALQQAKELEQKAKDKKRDDEDKRNNRPATPSQQERATPRVTPRPLGTPRPDDAGDYPR